MLSKKNISDRFKLIYENNLWSSEESFSGGGSEVAFTQYLQEWLVKTIPKLNIKNFVDDPCGDYNWMKLVVPKLNVTYIGLDIVPSIIYKNCQLYGNDNVKFKVSNICEDKLPSCDLIMVRDCLFHLSYEDIEKFLNNLKSTDYKYLLTSTHIVNKDFENKDIITGDFRKIDLFRALLILKKHMF